MHEHVSMFLSVYALLRTYCTACSASTACIVHKFITISSASCTSIGYVYMVPPYLHDSSLHDATPNCKALNEIQTMYTSGPLRTGLQWFQQNCMGWSGTWFDLVINFTEPAQSATASVPCCQLWVRQKCQANLIMLQMSTCPLLQGIKITVQSVMFPVVCCLPGSTYFRNACMVRGGLKSTLMLGL